jgi:uncharacterized protein YndB with AHSA1/START domain
MDSLTLRRWIDAAPAEVWRRLVDLDGLVVGDPELDLVDLTGDEVLRRGTRAVLSHRRGPRHVALEVEVVAAEAPFRLVLCVTAQRLRWTVRIESTPCAGPATDLQLHADLDPVSRRTAGLRGLVGTSERGAGRDVSALLESIARRAGAQAPVLR